MKLPGQYFRAGVGAVIINDDGLTLALERSDIPGAWQFPQGGLEAGEEPATAVYREIEEETGIPKANLDLIAAYPTPLAYELPPEARSQKSGRGQAQYWFLFRFTGNDRAISLTNSDEFSAWRWLLAGELLETVVAFRATGYRRLFAHFAAYLANESPK